MVTGHVLTTYMTLAVVYNMHKYRYRTLLSSAAVSQIYLVSPHNFLRVLNIHKMAAKATNVGVVAWLSLSILMVLELMAVMLRLTIS